MRPGNVWSLAFGTAAAVLMVFAAAYGIRRRSMRLASRLKAGSSRRWLDLHVYAGGLFALWVLMHSGFQLPSGWVTWALWLLSLWIALSGLVGRLIQRWIPRLLTSGLSVEALYERIPDLVDQVRERAAKLAEGSSQAVRDLHERRVAPELERPERRWIYFVDATGGIQASLREFRYLKGFLAGEEREQLDELERLYRTKLELDAHYTLQLPLRVWVWLHAPLSGLLIALLAVHLAAVLLY